MHALKWLILKKRHEFISDLHSFETISKQFTRKHLKSYDFLYKPYINKLHNLKVCIYFNISPRFV